MSEWHTVVVEGHERELRGFVSGFVADRGLDPNVVVLGDDVGLEHASLVERLRALVGGGNHVLLLPSDLADGMAEALGRGGAPIGLRVIDRHPVAGASFRFSAEVFSREVSATIRSICRTLPAGVHFEEHSEREDARSENAGVELYAPVHDYTYHVKGKLVGPLPGVLAVRRALGDVEAVQLEPLHLA